MHFPYLELDVPETASDEDVRRAYLLKIREFPPERSPEEFQRVCEAYESIKTELSRTRLRLFGLPETKPGARLAELAPKPKAVERRKAGVDLWIDAHPMKP